MNVRIYTTALCSYCLRAKKLFEDRDVAFDEIDVTFSPALRTEMVEKSNGTRSVPQIFIDGNHIGGCNELFAIEENGELDTLLFNEKLS